MSDQDNQISFRRRSFRHYLKNLEVIDYRLLVSVVFLLVFGFIMVYSATSATDGASTAAKQVLIGAVGCVFMIALSYFDYHVLARVSGALYLLALASIFLVFVPHLGVTQNGATRWIAIGSFQFQPSELMKPAIVLLTAYLLTQVGRKLTYIRADIIIFVPGVIAALAILVVTQNLSTAVIVMLIMFMMFFIAHPNKKIWGWVIAIAVALIAFWALYYNFMILPELAAARESGTVQLDSFRGGRILAWLFPDVFRDLSMQSRYSLYAIGFGGVLGRGLGHGTMKYYLPESSNDFIFAVIGEELGLVGCIMVIFLFIYQVWRIMVVAQHAKDLLGSYIAFGMGAHIAVQAILNIGVATSLLPNTGISLPYISQGGTAILVQLAEMGIVLNVSRQIHGKKVNVEEEDEGTVVHQRRHVLVRSGRRG